MVPARPTVETVVDRRRWTVFGRVVLPAAAALENMDDTADNPAVVHPTGAGLVRRKVRLDRRPRVIVQPENVPHTALQGIHNALEYDSQSESIG
jgi:hypothetical protein